MSSTQPIDNQQAVQNPTLPEGGELKNVWSRSTSRYRIRAIALLAINVLLFAGVGSFAYWLRSGSRFAPAQPGYWDELTQTFGSIGMAGREGVSLGHLLLQPISVQDVPMQIPILGLLMGALIAIPILVAILYRFGSSMPFVAVVGFLAVMPWLAATLFFSCLIASVRPLRTRFRFMSAMFGLLPAVIYLILAWSGTTDAVMGRIDPIDRIKFVAPWVLAIVSASIVFATVLGIAKLVDYRPGAIAPLLAVMFGLPVALFEFGVGRDELYYRLLESVNDYHFADKDASLPLRLAVRRSWAQHPAPRPSMDVVKEAVETRWQFELAADVGHEQSVLSGHQAELVDRCDWFLKYFPDSRYAPNALFIKARALDMRVDPEAFRRTKWIRFYDDFPSVASRSTWQTLTRVSPDSMLGAVAKLRIAQLNARDGKVQQALGVLGELCSRLDATHQQETTLSAAQVTVDSVLTRNAPELSLDISFDHLTLEAHRLHDLLRNNRDPIYGYDPIAGERRDSTDFPFGLLDLAPRYERTSAGGSAWSYRDNLRLLKRKYRNAQIEDNIDLEIAKASEKLPEQIERLETLVRDYPKRDAIPEALYRLGVAYRRSDQVEPSRRAVQRLVREYPDTIWTRWAARYSPKQEWPAGGRAPS